MTEPADRTRVGDRVTIYPRGKKGVYVADFWHDNVHRRVSLGTTNKKAAVERAIKIASDLHQGAYRQAPPAADIAQAAADYQTTLRTGGRAPKTLAKYAGVLRLFAEFLAAKRVTKLGQVTPGHFDAWRAARRAERHAKTVYCEGVIVKQFSKWARSRKLVTDDPLAGVRLDKPRSGPKGCPSLDEVNAILAAAGPPLRTHLAVLALTGMRVGELQRLLAGDVDLDGGWVHIASRPGAETKTRESRKVPLHTRLLAALRAYPRPKSGWFFAAEASARHPGRGRPLSAKRINDRLARVLERLGLPAGRESGFVAHSLRHFFETFAVNAGVPQRAVDSWLGHSSDKSMGAVYYRLLDEGSRRFMDRVPFGGPAGPATPGAPTVGAPNV